MDTNLAVAVGRAAEPDDTDAIGMLHHETAPGVVMFTKRHILRGWKLCEEFESLNSAGGTQWEFVFNYGSGRDEWDGAIPLMAQTAAMPLVTTGESKGAILTPVEMEVLETKYGPDSTASLAGVCEIISSLVKDANEWAFSVNGTGSGIDIRFTPDTPIHQKALVALYLARNVHQIHDVEATDKTFTVRVNRASRRPRTAASAGRPKNRGVFNTHNKRLATKAAPHRPSHVKPHTLKIK